MKTIIEKGITFFITGLIIGCTSPVEKNGSKLKGFYDKLNYNLNSAHFSPIGLIGSLKDTLLSFEIKDTDRGLEINQDSGKIQIGFQPITVVNNRSDGQISQTVLIMLFNEGDKQLINKLNSPKKDGKSIVLNTEIDQVKIKISASSSFFKWELVTDLKYDSVQIITTADGPFFGGGERFMSTNLNGRIISNQPHDHSWIKQENLALNSYEPTYLQVPFVLNPYGQGWYFDGATSMLLTFDKKGKSFNTTIKDNKFVLYNFFGENPKEVLQKYTSLLGRQPELPDWAYGVWLNLLEGQDSVLAKASRLKEHEMPVTAIWMFDMDDPNTSTGWPYWSKGTYSDYRKLTDSLHSLGYKALTYLRPFGYKDLLYYKFDNPFYLLYDSLGVILHSREELQGPRYSTFMKEGQYDFYNPMMGKLWKDVLTELLIKDNFDGWMEDFGDIGYSYDNEKNIWKPLDFGLDYPITNAEYANAYPLVYHKLTHEVSSTIKDGIATFSRSGSAGTASYSRMIWAGDQHANWDKRIGYPSAISSGISCGLSGYSNWTCDVLCDSPSRELWKRWVQFAAFTPLMRDHLWTNNPTAIDIWTEKETFEYFKKYARIHMDLVPYIQEASKKYRETGTPVIRHMMLDFPQDKETYSCEYQYMFGDKYLVAPVVDEGATNKDIYFPKGEWKSFWKDETIISNGEWINVEAQVDYIPVYERLK